MRTITRKNLEELAKTMSVIGINDQATYYGGVVDCFWYCVAYLDNGTSDIYDNAYSHAMSYWTDVLGSSISAAYHISSYGGMEYNAACSYMPDTSSAAGNIYYFDTGNISGFGDEEGWHAVVKVSSSGDTTTFYDPLNSKYVTINNADMNPEGIKNTKIVV